MSFFFAPLQQLSVVDERSLRGHLALPEHHKALLFRYASGVMTLIWNLHDFLVTLHAAKCDHRYLLCFCPETSDLHHVVLTLRKPRSLVRVLEATAARDFLRNL